ncbi:MAG: rhodanese-like domain-containing protein [Acidobacteriota bacterium]
MRTVSPGVAFEILRDNPNLLILDLRTENEYTGPLGHLAGAVNIPLDELDALLEQIEGTPRDALLVYCRADDECGEQGIAILASHGFNFPFLLAGGVEAWRAAGYGTVGGEGTSGGDYDRLKMPETKKEKG